MASNLRLLSSLSDFTDKVNITNTSTLLKRKTFAILIKDTDVKTFRGESLTIESDLDLSENGFTQENAISKNAPTKEGETNSTVHGKAATTSIEVPSTLLQDLGLEGKEERQRISYSVFGSGNLFQVQNISQLSVIVGVRVNSTKKLTHSIVVNFQPKQVLNYHLKYIYMQ